MSQPFNILRKLISGFAGGLIKDVVVGEQPTPDSIELRSSPKLKYVQVALWAGSALGLIVGLSYFAIWLGERGRKPLALLEPNSASEKTVVSVRPVRADLFIHSDVKLWNWTSIVLHHSATSAGSTSSFDRFHRFQKGWQSLGYHFVIGNGHQMRDGLVEAGPRWKKQQRGAHANSKEYNRNGIGICLVGNFENSEPTPRQMKATIKLVGDLCQRFKIPLSRVYGHGQIRGGGSTACPGKLFSIAAIVEGVQAREK